MLFRRRTPLPLAARLRGLIWPDGGMARASRYVLHRLRRLPDSPRKIARGVMAGVFVNFPPLFGVQFATAALIAWAIGGNLLAALFCTFLTNPLTTPFIVAASLELGWLILGMEGTMGVDAALSSIAAAGNEVWDNALALVSGGTLHWQHTAAFADTILLPYTVGSLPIGIVASALAYAAALPLANAWQRRRAAAAQARIERRLAQRAAALERAAAARTPADPGAGP